jgi:hypothetical protein
VFRPDPDLGFSYLRVLGCDTIAQFTDEITMHIPSGHDVSRDLIASYMNTLRGETVMCRPYVPRVGTRHGVAPNPDLPQQPYYRMRGLAIHISMVDTAPTPPVPLESIIATHCHVGPPGREITTTRVPGHAHLLQIRSVDTPMPPYVRAGMFMPTESARMLGESAQHALAQAHRASARTKVTEPVERQEMHRRQAPCMRVLALQSAASDACLYPCAYADAYKRAQSSQ